MPGYQRLLGHPATTMQPGLFEIQADYPRGSRRAATLRRLSEVVYAPFGRADPVSFHPTSHGITNGTEGVPNSGPKSVEPAVDPNADLARCFCVSPICPTTYSIASADMKQPCGAKSVRSCLLSMPWIALNHKRDGAGSVLLSGKTCQPTSAMSVDFRVRRLRHCPTRPGG